jgi:hypothetical protein
MVSFIVGKRLEATGSGRYAVRVSALPLGEQHCASEELVIVCDSREDANRAADMGVAGASGIGACALGCRSPSRW